jgi:hypothetical protein
MLDLDPALSLKPETAFFILLKAREFDAKVEGADPDEGSNPSDDRNIDVLDFQPDDAAEEELDGAIAALNEDERLDLIALAWIGRGDFGFDEWREAREAARDVDVVEAATYLHEMPALSDHLEEALSQLGLTVDDFLESGLRGPVAPGFEPVD